MQFHFCLHPCQFSQPTILCHQGIHPWDPIWYRGHPLCLRRGSHPRCWRWKYRCYGSWWKNQNEGAGANDAHNLLLGRTPNLRSEDTVEISVKGSLLMMITIQHRKIYLYRVRLLLVPVIGRERVLFALKNPATFKILSLISDIICMTLSFVCHCFSGF